jgi:hypothetical protein
LREFATRTLARTQFERVTFNNVGQAGCIGPWVETGVPLPSRFRDHCRRAATVHLFWGRSPPLKIETSPYHFGGVVARQTRSANVRSHGIDRARRRYTHISPTSAAQRSRLQRTRPRSASTSRRELGGVQRRSLTRTVATPARMSTRHELTFSCGKLG